MNPKNVLVMCVLAAAALPASAATLVLTATDDTFIRSGLGGSYIQNFGGNGEILVGTVASNDYARGLLTFDLSSSVLTGATINSVTLTFKSTTTDTGSTSATIGYSLYQLTQSFTEGTGTPTSNPAVATDATWVNRTTGTAWTTEGGTFNGTVLSSYSTNPNTLANGSTVTFGSSSAFIGVVSSAIGSSSFSLLAKQTTEGSVRELLRLSSSETANAPTLTIDYTPAVIPEPASFALLAGLASLGLIASRRRR